MRPSAARELAPILEASTAPIYNMAAVAKRCQIPAPTLRAWERRYGFPAPSRGARQQRLYSERDVESIHWLRARLGEGLTIAAALALLRECLARQAVDDPSGALGRPSEAASARSPSTLARQLERALIAFDMAEAGVILGEAFALYGIERVCLEVIRPMLSAIGAAWSAGEVDVAQEHAASAFIRQRLAAVFEVSNVGGRQRLVVATCAPEEWHELGLLTVALFLARHGWSVLYLGASVPLEGLERRLVLLRPTAIVFSASTEAAATALALVTRRLAQLRPPRPIIGYGGQIFEEDPALRENVPGLYLGPDAAAAVERLDAAVVAGSSDTIQR